MAGVKQLRDAISKIDSRSKTQFVTATEFASEESILTDGAYRRYTYNEIDIPSGAKEYLANLTRNTLDQEYDRINDGGEISEYDIRSVNRDQVPSLFINSDELPEFQRFHSLINGDLGETIDISESIPVFQAVRITNDEPIIAFKNFSKRQLLQSDDKFRISSNNDKYSTFDDEVVTLPDSFDAIFYDDEVYIFRPKQFEKLFDYFESYRQDADEVLSEIKSSDINIRGFDEFVNSILKDRRALRRMNEIENVGLYKRLSRSDIENVISEYGLSVSVETTNSGDWEIVLPDLRYKWDVLRILNDDHLQSQLTNEKYQVYEKDGR